MPVGADRESSKQHPAYVMLLSSNYNLDTDKYMYVEEIVFI
jgi:hypothetical protein